MEGKIFVIEYDYDGLLVSAGYFMSESSAQEYLDKHYKGYGDLNVRELSPNEEKARA